MTNKPSIQVVQITRYRTADGTEFGTLKEAIRYQIDELLFGSVDWRNQDYNLDDVLARSEELKSLLDEYAQA